MNLRTGLMIVAALLLGLLVFRLSEGDSPTLPPARAEVGDRLSPAVQVVPLAGGDPRPLSDEIVGPTVINFFASWCAPCRAENAVLLQLQSEGVRIVGVAVRDQPPATQAFLNELGDPFFRTMTDASGEAMTALGLGADLPQTLVISQDGEILYRHAGPLVGTDGDAAVAEIRDLAGPR